MAQRFYYNPIVVDDYARTFRTVIGEGTGSSSLEQPLLVTWITAVEKARMGLNIHVPVKVTFDTQHVWGDRTRKEKIVAIYVEPSKDDKNYIAFRLIDDAGPRLFQWRNTPGKVEQFTREGKRS